MAINLSTKKIVVTGGAGFLGQNVVRVLKSRGVREKNILIPTTDKYDLRLMKSCAQAVKGQDIVIHLAAKVGGIAANKEKPGEFFYDNLMMGVQLMEAARLAKVEKFVGIGSVCEYPKFSPIPFQEENLWDGYPEETNAPYGLAKKMLLVQGQAYRQQYGFNAVHLLPTNLYGPGDNFDPKYSHVLPALIRKVAEAKQTKQPYIQAWGTGKASREFLYVEDAAEAIVLAAEKYDKPDPVNIGASREISIKDLIQLIASNLNYPGEIRWDPAKPDGQPRRATDTSRALKEFGFKAKTKLEDGLKKTIAWYLKNHNDEPQKS